MLVFGVEYHWRELQIPSPSDPLAREGRKERSKLGEPVLSESISLFGDYFFYYYDNRDHQNCFFNPSK